MRKILIDSNVIIRIFSQDDEQQLKKAKEFFQDIEKGNTKGIVSLLVISEVIWILEKTYNFKRSEFLPKLQSLLAQKNILLLESIKEIVISTFHVMLSYKVDFTDAYLFVQSDEYEIFSFDKDFKKIDKK